MLAIGCSANNSVEQPLDAIPKKGENALPLISDFDYKTLKNKEVKNGKEKTNNSVSLSVVEPLLKKAQIEVGSDLVGVFSVKNSSGTWYSYNTTPLAFSEAATQAAEGKIQPLFFDYSEIGDNKSQRILAAYVPDSELAVKEFVNWAFPVTSFKQAAESTKSKLVESGDCIYTVKFQGKTMIFEIVYCSDEGTVTGGSPDPDFNWPAIPKFNDPCPAGCGGGRGGSGGTRDSGGKKDMCMPGYSKDEYGICVKDEISFAFMGHIEIDSTIINNPKVKCVLGKLFDNGNTLQNTIVKFAQESVDLDLVIELVEVSNDDLGNLTNAPNKPNTFLLQIDKSKAFDRLPIQIATTILHEAIHAEMRRYLYGAEDVSTLTGFPGSFAEDWVAYVRSQNGKNISQQTSIAEHNAMAQKYIDTIANGLQEFDAFSLTRDQYESLAWEGLIGTKAWNNKNQAQRNDIGSNYQIAINSSDSSCN